MVCVSYPSSKKQIIQEKSQVASEIIAGSEMNHRYGWHATIPSQHRNSVSSVIPITIREISVYIPNIFLRLFSGHGAEYKVYALKMTELT